MLLMAISVLCVGVFGVFVGISIMQKNRIAIVIHVVCLLLVVFTVVCEIEIFRENTLAVMNQAIEQGASITVPVKIHQEYERRYK